MRPRRRVGIESSFVRANVPYELIGGITGSCWFVRSVFSCFRVEVGDATWGGDEDEGAIKVSFRLTKSSEE